MPVMAWRWPVKTLIVPSGLGPCAPELGSGSTAPVRTSKQEVRSCTCLGYAPQCPPLRHAWEERLLLAPGEAGISWQIHPSVNTEVAKGILSHVHPLYHTQGAWVRNAGRDFIEESKGQKLGKVNRRGEETGMSALVRWARPSCRVSHGSRARHSPHLPPSSERQARPTLPGQR